MDENQVKSGEETKEHTIITNKNHNKHGKKSVTPQQTKNPMKAKGRTTMNV